MSFDLKALAMCDEIIDKFLEIIDNFLKLSDNYSITFFYLPIALSQNFLELSIISISY